MLNIHRHPHAFAGLTAIFSARQDSTVAGLFGPTIHPHFTGAVGNPSSCLPTESVPGADSAKENGMPRSIFALFPGVFGRLLPMRSIRLTLRFIASRSRIPAGRRITIGRTAGVEARGTDHGFGLGLGGDHPERGPPRVA